MNKSPRKVLEEYLVVECQNGNTKAYNQLARIWYPRILKQVQYHLKSDIAVEDVVQEVWMAISKGIVQLKKPEVFGAWALRIASLKSYDHIRNNQKDRGRSEDKREFHQRLALQEGSMDQDALIKTMKQSIDLLPVKQKQVLHMFYLENYSLLEIANILGLSTGTVKSRLFHAREHLKIQLKHFTYEK